MSSGVDSPEHSHVARASRRSTPAFRGVARDRGSFGRAVRILRFFLGKCDGGARFETHAPRAPRPSLPGRFPPSGALPAAPSPFARTIRRPHPAGATVDRGRERSTGRARSSLPAPDLPPARRELQRRLARRASGGRDRRGVRPGPLRAAPAYPAAAPGVPATASPVRTELRELRRRSTEAELRPPRVPPAVQR